MRKTNHLQLKFSQLNQPIYPKNKTHNKTPQKTPLAAINNKMFIIIPLQLHCNSLLCVNLPKYNRVFPCYCRYIYFPDDSSAELLCLLLLYILATFKVITRRDSAEQVSLATPLLRVMKPLFWKMLTCAYFIPAVLTTGHPTYSHINNV